MPAGVRVGGQTCMLKDWSVVADVEHPHSVIMAAKAVCIGQDERI